MKEKIIQEIIGNELEQIGFEYVKEDGKFYTYIREKEGIKQRITICNERFTKNYIKMYFSTNAYGQESKELEDFVPILQESWKYETEEELSNIIRQFKEWTFSHGLDLLEKISVPTTEERPRPETDWYLYEHHEELNKEGLNELNLIKKDHVSIAIALQKRIYELREEKKEFSQLEGSLIRMSAVYGHNMNLFDSGEWHWNEKEQTCEILNAGGSVVDLIPLKEVIKTYGNNSKDYFIDRFQNVVMYRSAENNTEDEQEKIMSIIETLYAWESGEDIDKV